VLNWLKDFKGIDLGDLSSVLDVAILAFIIYKAYKFLAGTQAAQLLRGTVYLAIIWGIAYILQLNTLLWILNRLGPGLIIALAIVLQPELRQIIMRLGLTQIFRPSNQQRKDDDLQAVINAAETLSALRRGALFVFPRKTNINHVINTGTRINGDISSALLVAIFQFDGPLHDLAVVILDGKVAAAGCQLPVSEQREIKKSFGSRHRAALGMSEVSDAVVLVVSEETGAISLAFDSQISYNLPSDIVLQKLRSLLDSSRQAKEKEAKKAAKVAGGMSEIESAAGEAADDAVLEESDGMGLEEGEGDNEIEGQNAGLRANVE